MKTEELQKYIKNLSPDLYSFAYILIPDDLQASQLMIDCVQVFLIQKNTLVERLTNTKIKLGKGHLDEIRNHLLKIVFDLSKRRYQQLKMSFSDIEQSGGFFSLEFDEKAILYLKEKAALELSPIEFIAGMTKAEVLAHLYSARIKMMESAPVQIFEETKESRGVV